MYSTRVGNNPSCKVVNNICLDIREELLKEDINYDRQKVYKCPELEIHINGVPVIALVDTGSQCNGMSADWYYRNKDKLGRVETLRLTNTTIKAAVGQRSKHISQQILVEVAVNQYKFDCVFVIIPGLIRDCILGIPLLQEGNCTINLQDNCITFHSQENQLEPPIIAEMCCVNVQRVRE